MNREYPRLSLGIVTHPGIMLKEQNGPGKKKNKGKEKANIKLPAFSLLILCEVLK